MADPATARRVIFSSYVIPQESISLEEGIEKWKIEEGVGKTFGGKGTADLTAAQWGDGWTSMHHSQVYWKQQGDNWEDAAEGWQGTLPVSSSAISLCSDTDFNSVVVKFCYIKNLGTVADQHIKVTLNGGGGGDDEYDMIVPAGGSVAFRGDGTTLQMQHVKVKIAGSTDTTIEYIIAK
jgi:hypothetical protein